MIVTSLSFPVTVLSANGVHHDVFVLLSARVNQHRRLDDYPTKKARLGLIINKMRAISEAGEDKGGSDGRVRLRCIS